jgi:hypothetical protein
MIAAALRALGLSALLMLATCGGDEPLPCCAEGVKVRCSWNPETMQFDRDCTASGGSGRNTISIPPGRCVAASSTLCRSRPDGGD